MRNFTSSEKRAAIGFRGILSVVKLLPCLQIRYTSRSSFLVRKYAIHREKERSLGYAVQEDAEQKDQPGHFSCGGGGNYRQMPRNPSLSCFSDDFYLVFLFFYMYLKRPLDTNTVKFFSIFSSFLYNSIFLAV
jgi:hypothetical protein